MSLKLIGIGGLGLMLNPSAKHLSANGPAHYLRIHDRGSKTAGRETFRENWRKHGAELVSSYEALVGDGEFDGVVICAGKNGDDFKILKELVPLLKSRSRNAPFIIHLSTLSAGFVSAANAFCKDNGIAYGNYPLTGGPAGAEAGTMLILASGNRALYQKAGDMLETIGTPRFFGESPTAGAEVKLIGHYMVFNGLTGITSAAALHAGCFDGGIGGDEQTGFFDFLNAGAGGTRQWDIALKKGVESDNWGQGFMIHHAVVDAIYAAQLGIEKQLPVYAILPMLNLALALAFLLHKYPGEPMATHAIVREFVGEHRAAFDDFLLEHLRYPDMEASVNGCIEALPGDIQDTVMLNISPSDF